MWQLADVPRTAHPDLPSLVEPRPAVSLVSPAILPHPSQVVVGMRQVKDNLLVLSEVAELMASGA